MTFLTRKRENVIGFLCVDSPNLGAFRNNYDVELLLGCADGIFNTVKKIRD